MLYFDIISSEKLLNVKLITQFTICLVLRKVQIIKLCFYLFQDQELINHGYKVSTSLGYISTISENTFQEFYILTQCRGRTQTFLLKGVFALFQMTLHAKRVMSDLY